MSKIEAKIVADSLNTHGNRLTTMIVTFPRFILAELNTHRLFSRNSASSRAIPFKKMVESVRENPFVPIAWQKDHSGMQGTEYFTKEEEVISVDMMKDDTLLFHYNGSLTQAWLSARNAAVTSAELLNKGNLTKQLCNRLLEPFMWHTVLVTSSEWDNFFKLRCPSYTIPDTTWNRINDQTVFRSRKDLKAACYDSNFDGFTELDWLSWNKGQAEIHMMALAEAMWDAINESTPKQLQPGEWHIPFGDTLHFRGSELFPAVFGISTEEEKNLLKIKIAVARCARVSYTVVGEEGKPANYENDIKLYDRLLASGHASPMEHIGRAMTDEEYYSSMMGMGDNPFDEEAHKIYPEEHQLGWSGNFRGFIQYRKTIE